MRTSASRVDVHGRAGAGRGGLGGLGGLVVVLAVEEGGRGVRVGEQPDRLGAPLVDAQRAVGLVVGQAAGELGDQSVELQRSALLQLHRDPPGAGAVPADRRPGHRCGDGTGARRPSRLPRPAGVGAPRCRPRSPWPRRSPGSGPGTSHPPPRSPRPRARPAPGSACATPRRPCGPPRPAAPGPGPRPRPAAAGGAGPAHPRPGAGSRPHPPGAPPPARPTAAPAAARRPPPDAGSSPRARSRAGSREDRGRWSRLSCLHFVVHTFEYQALASHLFGKVGA